ncbi:MAG: bifunctional hydroxymethylpyrimidine kinase/phosphomethylpyrimidine kinase [Opitutales bacterium]|nr:bifunctional hydroxymethylpyrimidine kinase/phosphomethylpyrimidine kinase [Opitutales bacterium]
MDQRISAFSGATALTVAGSDSGGGAGIQADLLTFAARGVFGTTAITCLTAQNPGGVSAVEALPPAFVREQMEQVARYFSLGAAKTGMLLNAGIIAEAAAFFAGQRDLPLVVDPVMVATSGAVLLERSAITALREQLLPRATVITPNLDEATVLLGQSIRPEDMETAALQLSDTFATAVLLKGGHLPGDDLLDVLVIPGEKARAYRHERIPGVHTHGSGCTLASAIAAELAKGEALPDAVETAIAYLRAGMRTPLPIGREYFIAHG